jgi:AcrR family transcriptional regulator
MVAGFGTSVEAVNDRSHRSVDNPDMTAGGSTSRQARVDRSSAPRDRVLEAASKLFARRGAARTGVDAIIAEAGVAKATLYRHFPAKEALVVAWLRAPDTRWFDRVRFEVEASHPRSSEELVGRLFDAVASWLEAGDYSGCPYLFEGYDARRPDRLTTVAVREYLDEIGAYLEGLAASASHPEPPIAARQLQSLLAGSITLGVAHGTSRYVVAAAGGARAVLGLPQRPHRGSRPA